VIQYVIRRKKSPEKGPSNKFPSQSCRFRRRTFLTRGRLERVPQQLRRDHAGLEGLRNALKNSSTKA
jgi:hypothetical protein